MRFAVVVPTIGRPSLYRLLETLEASAAAASVQPEQLVVVDDRPAGDDLELPGVTVLRTYGRGPAAARNAGWRSTSSPWVVFLDDDVELPLPWAAELARDLEAADPLVGAVQGRLHVPLPAHRRPTDWERGTAGLQDAAWATADMAYRREVLLATHGFDERFPRAYREDADLAIRTLARGHRLERGRRTTIHPVRPATWSASLRQQRGNADDVLMRHLHGSAWRSIGQVPSGRLPWHLATVAAAGATVLGSRRLRRAAAVAWLALTVDFVRVRLAPGPRPGEEGWAAETGRMLATSALIPFAAVAHRVRAQWRLRSGAAAWPPPVRAVLFDRDGTLVHDVPHNGDPALVRPVDTAAKAVRRAREAGLAVGVVTNQPALADGRLRRDQVQAVNGAVDAAVGPFDTWQVCPHGPGEGCRCRKPRAGLVLDAARELGVAPYECGVVGDIGADVGAAITAGARSVLVPTPATRAEEVAAAPRVAAHLEEAVDVLLDPGPAS
jgi:HAD superfamily hydrolase (TIGR01662 family)